MPTPAGTGAGITAAMTAAGMTQRELAGATGISQPTLSRIASGSRRAKSNELLAIAWATGHTARELSGQSEIDTRVQIVARATDEASLESMRRQVVHFLEMDAYLEDQGIAIQA